jgi:hypothetical protein
MKRALAGVIVLGLAVVGACDAADAPAAKPPPPLPAAQNDVYGQPQSERAAQQSLPQSRDSIWVTLQRTVIAEDTKQGIYTAKHPPEVQALVGKTLTVQGFMLPYTTDTQVRQFLLTRYTPVCFFCPPGAPNEVIDVSVEKPVKWEDRLYSVTGIFAIQNNGEKGLFFRLDNARVLDRGVLEEQGKPKPASRPATPAAGGG